MLCVLWLLLPRVRGQETKRDGSTYKKISVVDDFFLGCLVTNDVPSIWANNHFTYHLFFTSIATLYNSFVLLLKTAVGNWRPVCLGRDRSQNSFAGLGLREIRAGECLGQLKLGLLTQTGALFMSLRHNLSDGTSFCVRLFE